MSINQLDELNRKQLEKREEVLTLLNAVLAIENASFDFSLEKITRELRGLSKKFGRDTINISIVSEVSSGKSTFLNALLFNDLVLESKLGETTAKIFKIKYGEDYSIDGQKVKDLNSLKEAISKENQTNLEVIEKNQPLHQIQSTITLPHENLKKGIELYDTPGFATINESSMLHLIREAIIESDATILLLNIAQGIKKSEEEFIKDMLHRISPNKRFIVLNKFDSIMDEDELLLKSKEEIESELNRVISSIEEILGAFQNKGEETLQTYYLSAKKALVGKKHQDEKRLQESRFPLFEEIFWKRVVAAKDELYDDNVLLLSLLKKELKEKLIAYNVGLKKSIIIQEQQLNGYLKKEKHLVVIPKKIETLIISHEALIKEKREGVGKVEVRLLSHLKDMLFINLLSELKSAPFWEKLQFWKLKKSYEKRVITVINNAEEYLIAELERFIQKILEREEDKPLYKLVDEINKILSIDTSFHHLSYNRAWQQPINILKEKIEKNVVWSRDKELALLKYNFIRREDALLMYHHNELDDLISKLKEELLEQLARSQGGLDDYLSLVSQKEKEIQDSLRNKEELYEEISALKQLNEEMERLIQTIEDE